MVNHNPNPLSSMLHFGFSSGQRAGSLQQLTPESASRSYEFGPMAADKGNLFRDQSSSSRVERLKQSAMAKVKASHPKSGFVKFEHDKNSRLDALTRVRSGGAVVPQQVRHSNSLVTLLIDVIKLVFSE